MRWFGKFGRGTSRVTSDMSVGLTETGKKKADEFTASGPKFEVMATLREQGPCTMSELSEETHISSDKLKHIIRVLKAQGYVRYVGSEED